MAPWQRYFLLPLAVPVFGAYDIAWGDDSDLTSFVTRPEIKAPKFNVSIYDRSKVTPGYWFVAPYAHVYQHVQAPRYYQPCQTGPLIYDNNGDLVWSGACLVRNQNTFDFRAWSFNGSQYLSAIHSSFADVGDNKGHGILLNGTYDIVRNVSSPSTIPGFNMHELNIFDEGRKALYLMWDPIRLPVGTLDVDVESGWVGDMGFHEIDLTTGDVLFEWWANRAGHVSLGESGQPVRDLAGPWPKAWNWFHGNSIEKNSEGDYILSSRYTNTIYKVSGENGAVLWRLGGLQSSFKQNFNFSGQHDAKTQYIDDEVEILSFLDNASTETTETSDHSSALVVELNRRKMTANIVLEIPRPDGNLTRLRGNHQVLSNGNHFIHWSENSYMSEHDPDGELLMEAKFASRRFVNYRAYKFNFTGEPSESPTVVGQLHGQSPSKSTTVFYVSWNGATEVSSWKFYGQTDSKSNGPFKLVGHISKTGFETVFNADGYYSAIYVEGICDDGTVLGASKRVRLTAPNVWGTALSTDEIHPSDGKATVEPAVKVTQPQQDSMFHNVSVVVVYPWVVYVAGAAEVLVCLALGASYFRPRRRGLTRTRRIALKENWI